MTHTDTAARIAAALKMAEELGSQRAIRLLTQAGEIELATAEAFTDAVQSGEYEKAEKIALLMPKRVKGEHVKMLKRAEQMLETCKKQDQHNSAKTAFEGLVSPESLRRVLAA